MILCRTIIPVLREFSCRCSEVTARDRRTMAAILPSEIEGTKADASRIGAVASPNPGIRCKDYARDCCSARLVALNQANFRRSGVPSRFMFYRDGSWVDFPSRVLENVKPGFLERRTAMDVLIDGSRYRFDFLRMLQIDILTGKGRSIAWIDVKGKCFFPKTFVSEETVANSGSEDLKAGCKIRSGEEFRKRKRENLDSQEESEGNSSTNREAVSRRWNSSDQEAESKRPRIETACDSDASKWPNVKLMEKGSRPYTMAEKFFLSRVKHIDPDDEAVRVTAIHQCTWKGVLERARWDVFHKQMERTKAARGICSTTFAWHGASAKSIASILTYGFGLGGQIDASESQGFGIYLSSVRLPHISAMTSEADHNGEKHVVLCRVILGTVEKVVAGPHPSNVSFDTGVDNIENPNWYMVKWANMNTHILPQCVVSYKSPQSAAGKMGSLAFLKWVPYSTNAFVVKLFSKLENLLPSDKVEELESWCKSFKDGKLAKGTFLKQLRIIVGDEVLLSTIHEIRCSE